MYYFKMGDKKNLKIFMYIFYKNFIKIILLFDLFVFVIVYFFVII